MWVELEPLGQGQQEIAAMWDQLFPTEVLNRWNEAKNPCFIQGWQERFSSSDLSLDSSNGEIHHVCLAAHQPVLFITSCDFPPQICLWSNWEMDPLSVLWEFLWINPFPLELLSLSSSSWVSRCCWNIPDWTGFQCRGFLLCQSWVPHSQLQSTVQTHCWQIFSCFWSPCWVLCPLMILPCLLSHEKAFVPFITLTKCPVNLPVCPEISLPLISTLVISDLSFSLFLFAVT